MFDSIANFPLRSASKDELGVALARCYAEYNQWHGQANFIANFANDARLAGVHSIVADRIQESIDLGEAMGVVRFPTRTKDNTEIAKEIAEHQLLTADVGVKIAALAMLHNACERFLWRLVRLGLVANRSEAIKWIAKRKVQVEDFADVESDIVVDQQLENWWEELERASMLKKWDKLVGLVGYPEKLADQNWHFDRDMLANFDEIRHNAVHNDARTIKEFDFVEYAKQSWRAQLVWLAQVAMQLQLTIPGEVALGMNSEPT